MTRPMVLLALACLGLCAQEKEIPLLQKEERPEIVQRIVELQHQKPAEIGALLSNSGVQVRASEPLKAISLYGPKNLVEALEAEIRRLDKPVMVTWRNIDLVAYFMLTSTKGGAGGALPKELEPVARQLESIFGMRDFRLFETAFMRAREGTPMETSGSVQVPVSGSGFPPSNYQIRCRSTSISHMGTSRVIRLDDFRFGIRVPYTLPSSAQFQFSDVVLNTNLDIREGQKVVVGQSRVGEGDASLVLVLTARVTE